MPIIIFWGDEFVLNFGQFIKKCLLDNYHFYIFPYLCDRFLQKPKRL